LKLIKNIILEHSWIFLESANKYDDYATTDVNNVKDNKDGFIDLSSTYNNEDKSLQINNYHDLFSNMNELLLEIDEFQKSLSNEDREQLNGQLNEIKNNIDNAMNKLYKHIKGNKLKLVEAINEFEEISNGAKMLFNTHTKLLSSGNNSNKPINNFENFILIYFNKSKYIF